MKELYEQVRARENKRSNCGRDPVMLVYPSISSCATLTYFFASDLSEDDDILTGAHFGQFNEDGPLSEADLKKMLAELCSLDKRRPTYAFLIGMLGSWDPTLLDVMRTDAVTRLGRPLSRCEEVCFAENYESAELQIIASGVIRIKPMVTHYGDPLHHKDHSVVTGHEEVWYFTVPAAHRPFAHSKILIDVPPKSIANLKYPLLTTRGHYHA